MAHDGKRESWERHPRVSSDTPAPGPAAQPSAETQAQAPVPAAEPAAQPPADQLVRAPATPQEILPVTPSEVRTASPPVAPAPASPAQKIVFDTYNATITRMETHHSGLWEFDFALDKPMRFVAGQYVSIYLPGMKPAPFSIASSPVHTDSLVLGIEVVGAVTGALSRMKPGDAVTLKGPFGRFVIGPGERKVCMMAGGIGITPFMSMLRWVRDTNPDVRGVLFYSCKGRDQFMWADELEEMRRTHPNIKVVFTMTRDTPQGWNCRTGRISEEMVREELPDYMDYVFFSCGPPALIDAVFGLLKSMGVDEKNLRREAWH